METTCTRSESLSNDNGRLESYGLKVVITGGCGFLGRHIARSVYREFSNVKITLMDVKPINTALMEFITNGVLNGQPITFTTIDRDITRLPHLTKVFQGADVVFHCAGKMEMEANSKRMHLVNVDGTRNVIKACEVCGVRVLVYTGSLAQILKARVSNQKDIDEATCFSSGDNLLTPHYGETKNNAERLVLEAGKAPLYTCSLRCPPLYGEYDNTFIPSAALAAQRFFGYYPNCGKPNKKMTAMYVGNAAWAHVCAAKCLLDSSTRDAINGQFFYIGDDTPSENYTSFFMRFLRPLKYRSTFRIPVVILEIMFLIASIVVIFPSIFGIRISSPLLNYHRHVRSLSINHTVSWNKAQVTLGYTPQTDFQKAFDNSMRWYCDNVRI